MRGILNILKYVNETNAVWASRTLLGSIRTYTVKEDRATRKGAQVQRKVVKAFIYAAFLRAVISPSLIFKIWS